MVTPKVLRLIFVPTVDETEHEFSLFCAFKGYTPEN